MPKIEANNILLSYRLEGPDHAETIVLIDGLADDLTTWSSNTPAFLAAGYRVLSYDNRGTGHSSRPPGPYTAELLADDLHALLQILSITTAHFIGVSMGGMILQFYALKYPNTPSSEVAILSLTLACTYAQPTAFCSRMFKLWEEMAQRMSVQDVMRDVTLWAFTVPFFRTRTAELEEVEKAMRELDMPLEAYLAQLNVIQRFDSTSALENLDREGKGLGGVEAGKVMVLAGEEDILIPTQLSRELHGMIAGSRFKAVRGGHACLWEFPDSFNAAIVDFLTSLKA